MAAAVISNSIKGEAVRGPGGCCPLGTWLEAPGSHFRGSWVCDVMATMTGCWAGVTWCWTEAVPLSSSIFGRLVRGSAKVSALGGLLTSTGGELEACAAKICSGLLRPGEGMRENKSLNDRIFMTLFLYGINTFGILFSLYIDHAVMLWLLCFNCIFMAYYTRPIYYYS